MRTNDSLKRKGLCFFYNFILNIYVVYLIEGTVIAIVSIKQSAAKNVYHSREYRYMWFHLLVLINILIPLV